MTQYGDTTFEDNPDLNDVKLSSKFGIYEPHCGLENVMISWGHDEYLYMICKNQSTLPPASLHMIVSHAYFIPKSSLRKIDISL